MSKDKIERLVPFTPDMVDEIKETAEEDGRAFKHQAAALIREALATRRKKSNA